MPPWYSVTTSQRMSGVVAHSFSSRAISARCASRKAAPSLPWVAFVNTPVTSVMSSSLLISMAGHCRSCGAVVA